MARRLAERTELQEGLESLLEHLRDGPLTSLALLQRRVEDVTAEQLAGEDVVEVLESLVVLTQSGMLCFHEFTGELQRLVDRLACRHREQMAAEPRDCLQPN